MAVTNNAMLIRRELYQYITKYITQGNLTKIDKIPLKMRPKSSSSSRCCIYKDRAMLRYKLMAMMGVSTQNDEDELKSLAWFAEQNFNQDADEMPVLRVVHEACSSCHKGNYVVTNMCQACVGRPCEINCPKGAIAFHNGQAQIDHSKCVNCGLCQDMCPYHAIVYKPVPCEEACPVGAISKNETGSEVIDDEKCIHCGKCLVACPYGAIVEYSHIFRVLPKLREGRQVVAMVAPAIAGQFKADMGQIREALLMLGFADAVEVAEGADETIRREAAEFDQRMDEGAQLMTTSCCPSYVELTRKHLPKLSSMVSHTKTPMHYAGKQIRKQYPEALTVFIGPCVGKKSEARRDKYVDFVLNFEEVGAWFISAGVDVNKLNGQPADQQASADAAGFAASGGVTHAIQAQLSGRYPLHEQVINGISKTGIKTMKSMARGKSEGNFVEVMACEHGCIGGCNTISLPKVSRRQLDKLVKERRAKEQEANIRCTDV